MGIFGALRSDEMLKMNAVDVDEREDVIVVKIPKTKNGVARSFTIVDEREFCAMELVKQYSRLRPVGLERYFLTYRNQKCTSQPVGKNTFGAIPKKVAEFLGLENAQKYTGHCLRRSSATLLADSGANMTTLKRHGGWKSSCVAEGYIADSMASKNQISNLISGTSNSKVGTQQISSIQTTSKELSIAPAGDSVFSGRFVNCTFNLYQK